MLPQDSDPIAVVLLANSIDTKLAKACAGQIEEGSTHQANLTAKLKGTVKRREAATAKPTARLLNKAILAELMRRLGVTREAFQKQLLDIATEAIAAQTTTAEQMEAANPEILLAIRDIEKHIVDKLPRDHRPGRIEVAATVELSAIKIT